MGGGRLGLKCHECGRWEIGVKKMWDVGDLVKKIVGGGRFGVKKCGRWEIDQPDLPPPLMG